MNVSRREFVAAAVAAGAVAGSADADTAGSQAIGGWPTAHHDLANTGYAPDEAPPEWPRVPGWETPFGGAVAGATVEDGVVYVGSEDGTVAALDAGSGDPMWQQDIGSPVQTEPVVGEEAVFFGAEDGIHAVDIDSDVSFWTVETDGGAAAAPKFVDSTVYAGADDGYFYIIDPRTGDVRRRIDVGSPIRSAPAVDGNRAYVGSERGYVTAIDTKRGQTLWSTGLGEVATAPVVDGNRVFAGSSEGVAYSLGLDGSVAWRTETSAPVTVPPAVVDGTPVFVDDDGTILALNAGGGSFRWRVYVEERPRAPAVAGDTLYVASETNRLYTVDVGAGELRNQRDLPATPSDPVVVDERLLFGLGDRFVSMQHRGATPTPAATASTTGDQGDGGTATATNGGNGGGGDDDDGGGGATETTSDGGIWSLATLATAGAGGFVTLLLWLRSKK